jgi:hypothetical protein
MEDLAQAVWRTSTLSGGGNCVEACFLPDKVALRDSKDRHGSVLFFTHSEWAAFIGGVHRGEFALPDDASVPLTVGPPLQ